MARRQMLSSLGPALPAKKEHSWQKGALGPPKTSHRLLVGPPVQGFRLLRKAEVAAAIKVRETKRERSAHHVGSAADAEKC